MKPPPPYSWEELQACAEREVGWRKKVYPNRVQANRMTQHQALLEIRRMEAIVEHFAELAKGERLL